MAAAADGDDGSRQSADALRSRVFPLHLGRDACVAAGITG
jgi:hypothetical protein